MPPKTEKQIAAARKAIQKVNEMKKLSQISKFLKRDKIKVVSDDEAESDDEGKKYVLHIDESEERVKPIENEKVSKKSPDREPEKIEKSEEKKEQEEASQIEPPKLVRQVAYCEPPKNDELEMTKKELKEMREQMKLMKEQQDKLRDETESYVRSKKEALDLMRSKIAIRF